MTYYDVCQFLTIFIMATVVMLVRNNDVMEREVKRKFYILTLAVTVASICDGFGLLLNREQFLALRGLHIGVKTLEFCLGPLIPIICASIIGKIRHKKLIMAGLIVNALLEIISAFTGFIYCVDADNNYFHADYYWIYVLAYCLAIFFAFIVLLKEGKKNYGMRGAVVFMFLLLISYAIGIQLLNSSVRVIWLCTTVEVLLIYIYYADIVENTDSLTRLLNRHSYDGRLLVIKEPAMIFFFDVDGFKQINDHLGHQYGDEILIKIGRILKSTFGDRGKCYRIGGDEFCAIVDIYEEEVTSFERRFYDKLAEAKVEDPHMPYVSVGHAFFNPAIGDVWETVDTADTRMYENKKANKAIRTE